jgi:hypothetical protein
MFQNIPTPTLRRKFSAYDDGGRAEGLACAAPGARTPIGLSGILHTLPAKQDKTSAKKLNLNLDYLSNYYFMKCGESEI